MDCLLFYNDYRTLEINGSIINAFEYYLAIKRYNKDFRLVFVNFQEDFLNYLIQTISERFVNLPGDWADGVVSLSRLDVLKTRFNRVLILDYSTMKCLKGCLKPKEAIIISEGHTDDPDYFWDPEKYNATYYGEMPFEFKHEQYTMKMLFEHYKTYGEFKPWVFVSSPEYTWFRDKSFLDKINLPKGKKYLLKDRLAVKDFQTFYDELIYYKSPRVTDRHPRLFAESVFYGKKISYINETEEKDGSFYRFHDALNNGWEHRLFTGEDEIIRRFK